MVTTLLNRMLFSFSCHSYIGLKKAKKKCKNCILEKFWKVIKKDTKFMETFGKCHSFIAYMTHRKITNSCLYLACWLNSQLSSSLNYELYRNLEIACVYMPN